MFLSYKFILTEESDGELNEPQRHGLVPRVDAAQDEQHGAYFGGRVDEHEEREEQHVPHEVAALQLAVAHLGYGVVLPARGQQRRWQARVRPDTRTVRELEGERSFSTRRYMPWDGILLMYVYSS